MDATPREGAAERPEQGGDPPVVVLVALEPRSYREAIGYAIGVLRPHLRVKVVEPGELGAEVTRLDPELVLSSRPNTSTSSAGPSWLEFRPFEEPTATLHVGGRRSELEKVELDDLLSVVDRQTAPSTRGGR